MPVYKDKNGTYKVRYRSVDILTGKTVEHTKRGFKFRREAVDFEKSITNKQSINVKEMTFAEMAHEWELANESSQLMIDKHKQAFSLRFNDYYNLPMSKFSKPMLIKWRIYLSSLECSTRTKNVTLGFVKAVFAYASSVYDMPNPAGLLKPFKKTDQEVLKQMDVWTPEEFNKFLEHVNGDIYKVYFETLFWTGARRGEVIALLRGDIQDGRLHISHSMKHAKNGRKPTKTKQDRYIDIDSQLLEHIYAVAPDDTEQYLFGGSAPLAPSSIAREFEHAIKAAGVKRIRLHDLRHSHATWLINNGANIVAVSKRLGHATIEQTLKTYTHLLQESNSQLLGIIEKEKQKH